MANLPFLLILTYDVGGVPLVNISFALGWYGHAGAYDDWYGVGWYEDGVGWYEDGGILGKI